MSRKTGADRWNEQYDLNWGADWREAHQIRAKMSRCPNNPANGGDWYDTGDGTFTDRRTEIHFYAVDDEDPARQDTKMRRRWR
jgi:hypothetical protein